MNDIYKKQVELLLKILPFIAEEKNFALHGGTAINLFHLNMPRLSVDIDITCIPFSNDRIMDLKNIRFSLESIKTRLKKQMPDIYFPDQHKSLDALKLICKSQNSTVKIEVNQINRGLIAKSQTRILCDLAQEIFGRFCEVTTVSTSQLWGGKINAALDRQHPRDMFDIMNLFNETGYTDEIKTGFIFYLLCNNRPFHEVLNPGRIDQQEVFESQFAYMTDMPFSYEEYEKVRERTILEVNKSLTDKDKDFLLAFAKGEPIWDHADYSAYPAIKWKLLNIRKLKANDPKKYDKQTGLLQEHFKTTVEQ